MTGAPKQPRSSRQKPKAARHRKPPLTVFPTTLWEYPSQHYGSGMQGDKNYTGATPSWVVWQLLSRYTRPGDRVLDPMCGSGTTLDVCKDLDRSGVGFDLAPTRPDIARADARSLPVEKESFDFVFIDPPYSTHVDYSDDPACIGRLDVFESPEAYYDAMRGVIAEIDRVLRDRRYMALYVSDSYKKRKPPTPNFEPIGFELFALLRERFVAADIICVARKNAKLKQGNWRKAAVEENFFLRGFNYCFIMKKDGRAMDARGQKRHANPAPVKKSSA